jgi:capsular exopolysaccharide synthesis family protein
MDRRLIWSMLRRWGWLIAAGMLLVGGTAFAVSTLLPKTYTAIATILVNQQSSSTAGAQTSDVLYSQQMVRTYESMILTQPVLEQVISGLGLNMTTEELAKHISTRIPRETVTIKIMADDHDPKLAQRLANTVAQTFMEQNRRLSVGNLTTSKETLARQIAKLSGDIDNTAQQVERLRTIVVGGNGTPQDTVLLQQLQTELSQNQVTYSTLLKNMQEIELSESRAAEGLRLIEPAVEPIKPSKPNVPLNTGAGLLVGLVVSIGLAALLQYLDDTVKGNEDTSRVLGAPVLGVVSQFKSTDDRGKDLVTVEAPRSAASESYRTVRTNVQFSSLDVPVGSIVVTSAQSREGKSTVAANLAVTMAQAGKRVLLVDADLRRPALHRLFGLSNRHGLTDLLLNERRAVEDLALDTHVPGLQVLPSGPQPPNPSEALGSRRMRQVLEEMRQIADMVILDSPPLLAVADGLVLGATVDAAILVVRSGGTRRTLAQRAKDQLDRVEARLLGIVVNAAPRHAQEEGFYAPYYIEGALPTAQNGHATAEDAATTSAREG